MISRILIIVMPIVLVVKAPLLAYNSFVEAIYVLNDCHAHNGHNNLDSKQSRTKDQAFSIRYLCYTLPGSCNIGICDLSIGVDDF